VAGVVDGWELRVESSGEGNNGMLEDRILDTGFWILDAGMEGSVGVSECRSGGLTD